MDAVDIPQLESFAAATAFAKAEGIIPAPEAPTPSPPPYARLKAKEEGREKVILFNLSGHGLIDMTAYDRYIA